MLHTLKFPANKQLNKTYIKAYSILLLTIKVFLSWSILPQIPFIFLMQFIDEM